MKAIIVAAFLLSAPMAPAEAAEPTFTSLQTMCRNTTNPQQQGYCAGFVEAVAARITCEDKGCAFLRSYIDHANADLALTDVIADIDGTGYPTSAFEAVQKFLYSHGCS